MADQSGIDVSHHQGTIDWTQVASAGVTFAYIKATEGGSIVDKQFAANWKGAKAAGIRRGAYHFFAPQTSVETQVANFTATVTLASGDLPPVLDLELDNQKWSAVAPEDRVPISLEFLQSVESHYGRRPLVYTNKRTITDIFGDAPGKLTEYPLWVASYKNPPPTLPTGWNSWVIWQYSQQGTINGISGPVDLDRAPAMPVQLAVPSLEPKRARRASAATRRTTAARRTGRRKRRVR